MFFLFHAFNPFWEKLIKIQYSSFPLYPVVYPFRIATQLQYYVKREKCKVNDVIFPYGCKAHAINLGNKNMKIGIFTGAASVRSKNIFTDISRYPTEKHEIKNLILESFQDLVLIEAIVMCLMRVQPMRRSVSQKFDTFSTVLLHYQVTKFQSF